MQDHKDYFILIKKKNRLYICGAAQESKDYMELGALMVLLVVAGKTSYCISF